MKRSLATLLLLAACAGCAATAPVDRVSQPVETHTGPAWAPPPPALRDTLVAVFASVSEQWPKASRNGVGWTNCWEVTK